MQLPATVNHGVCHTDDHFVGADRALAGSPFKTGDGVSGRRSNVGNDGSLNLVRTS